VTHAGTPIHAFEELPRKKWVYTSGIMGFGNAMLAFMGRASRANRERRECTHVVLAAPATSKGGRPRVHADIAAKQRAYRLRKKLGADAPTGSTDASVVLAWIYLADPGRARYLATTAAQLGSEWLDFALDIEAEAWDAEQDPS
jgi:hypothetical protein